MTKKAKRVDKMHRAILALCRLQRKQIQELGILRGYILELRAHQQFLDPGWAAFPVAPRRHSPTDPVDSPQPPLD